MGSSRQSSIAVDRAAPALRRPRLGFLGAGWIGRSRLAAVVHGGAAEIAAIADPDDGRRREAAELAPGARSGSSLDDLLREPLDGVVIATPSALHAEQALTCLRQGIAVFCQKPLARNAAEARDVVAAARAADRPLGVDLCYRHVRGVAEMRRLVQAGELGRIHAAELTFHNAYGPDKSWCYDAKLSGGGCLIDLGTHLVDLALWMLGFPAALRVHGRRHAQGRRLGPHDPGVEDFASAELELATGATVRLACSWRLPIGQDAIIEASFYGPRGAVSLRNVSGSFYDFQADHCAGRARVRLADPPDDWGGRAISAWVERLAAGAGFDPRASEFVRVAAVLDRIYGR